MGAFNLLIVTGNCPACGRNAELVFQVHTAASFDGDERGRFQRDYRPGEIMAWFPRDHPKFNAWRNDGRLDRSGQPNHEDEEICYGDCPRCSASLTAMVRITDFVPTVISIHGEHGPADGDWGTGYTGRYHW